MYDPLNNQIIQEDMQDLESRMGDWRWLQGKTVFVSGAYGMLVSYMVYFLIYLNETYVDANIRIIAQGRSWEKMTNRYGRYVEKDWFVSFVDNICQPVTVAGPVDYIIHAASLASPQFYGVNPTGTLLPNSVGTYYLLELAREKKTEGFLFFSSGDVYGKMPVGTQVIHENDSGVLDPTNLRSCYGESKRIGETMCKAWSHQYGVAAKSVRIFHTYGPTMDWRNDERVFASFVKNILTGEDIIMKSDGSAIRQFCYLVDAVDGFFRVLRDGVAGEAYNMCNTEAELSVLELSQLLVGLVPCKEMKVVRMPRDTRGEGKEQYIESPVKRSVPGDTTRLKSLGWQPRYSAREGFARTLKSFGEEIER